MKFVFASFTRLQNLFRRTRLDRELSEELASHLEMHIADNVRAGMTPEEARRNALIKLGGVEQTKEKYRERGGWPLLETWRKICDSGCACCERIRGSPPSPCSR